MHALSRITTLACLLALTACQVHQAPPSRDNLTREQYAKLQFAYESGKAFQKAGNAANTEKLSGSFKVIFIVNDANWLVACTTSPTPEIQDPERAYNPRLEQQMASLCSTVVLPEVPAELADASGQTTIIAPLIFAPFGEQSEEQEQRRNARVTEYAQQLFFWKQALASEVLSSIGIAHFSAFANTKGQVQSCEVVIEPHPLRRRSFVPDVALVQRLEQRCKQLDLRTMPGFTVDEQGSATAFVDVEYTPWKNGVPTKLPEPVKTP